MKKQITVTCILLCIGINALCQVNLDSLRTVWNNQSLADTIRLQAVDKIAREAYAESQNDSAYYFAQLQYDFAESKGHKKQMADALNTQGQAVKKQSDYASAIDYYTRSLTIREELGDKKGIASSLHNIGIIYYYQANFVSAIDYYTRSLAIKKELGDKRGIAALLNNIGIIYSEQGDNASAIDYYTLCLASMEEIGGKTGIATSLNNIGNIYKQQGELVSAKDYYTRSLTINEEIGNKTGMTFSLGNIGRIYLEQGDLVSAIDYSNRSLTISEELGDKRVIAASLNDIGRIYYEQGDYASAKDYYTRSLKINEELGDKTGIATSLTSIGEIYKEQGDFVSAIEYCKRSLTLAQEVGAVLETRYAANTLYLAYKSTGQFPKALEMHELFISISDSISSEENQKEVIRQEYKYAYERQAAADSVFAAEAQKVTNAQLKAQQAQLLQEKTQRYTLYGGIGVLLLFGGLIYNRLRITRKQKIIIESQNEKLESQKEEMLSQNEELQTSLESQNKSQLELESAKEYLDLALSSAKMGTWEYFVSENKFLLDEQLERYFGYEIGEFPSTLEGWLTHIHPDDLERTKENAQKSIESATHYEDEYRIIRKDGEVRYMIAKGNFFINTETQGSHATGLSWDITEKKLASENLMKLSRAIEQTPATVIITDKKGMIEYVNPKFSEDTGYTHDEAVGQNARILGSDHHPPEFFNELWGTVLSGKEWFGEFLNKRKNGELSWQSAIIAPIFGDNKEITHFVSIQEDITEKKRNAEELLKLSRALEVSPATVIITNNKGIIEYVNPYF